MDFTCLQQYTASSLTQKLLFSPRCLHCGNPARVEGLWCFSCFRGLRKRCLPIEGNALFSHDSLTTTLLTSIREKNPKNIALLLRLLRKVLPNLCQKEALDTLILVPSFLHFWKREYSGLEIIGASLAQELHLQFLPRFLEKPKPHSQHTKVGEDRLDGPMFLAMRKGAASCEGKRILLMDDVFTTGTSLLQAEILLRTAGAKRVTIFTLLKRELVVGVELEGKKQESRHESAEIPPMV